MGYETPISFNLRRYVVKRSKVSYNTDYIVPDMIDFFDNDHNTDWKKKYLYL